MPKKSNIDYFKECNTLEEVTKEFRKLSLKYHPDKNPNNKDAGEIFTALAIQRAAAIERIEFANEPTDEEFLNDLMQSVNVFNHMANLGKMFSKGKPDKRAIKNMHQIFVDLKQSQNKTNGRK